MTYEVLEYNFTFLGTVVAHNADDALAIAKMKYRSAVAVMVAPIPH
jgi:hypothetical protein